MISGLRRAVRSSNAANGIVASALISAAPDVSRLISRFDPPRRIM